MKLYTHLLGTYYLYHTVWRHNVHNTGSEDILFIRYFLGDVLFITQSLGDMLLITHFRKGHTVYNTPSGDILFV